jgi:pentatricopeptide repeat protein
MSKYFTSAAISTEQPHNYSYCNNNLSRQNLLDVPVNELNHDYDYRYDYASLLQGCGNIKSVNQVHTHILMTGLHQDVFLGTKLVSMYTTHGSVESARLVFDKIYKRNVFLWNAIIRCYARNGPSQEALVLYNQMLSAGNGIQPDKFTYPFVLKACARLSALEQGQEVHQHILASGCELESHEVVGTALIDMYVKCARIEIARQLFDKMSTRNVVSWNAMIAGYAQNGYDNEALVLFDQMMQITDVKPDSVTMTSVLRACAHLADLQKGEDIHHYIMNNGFQSDVSVGTALVSMYSKCGSIDFARQLFDKMSKRDVVSWNSMIAGYAQNGLAIEALTLFYQMQVLAVKPDSVTLLSLLTTCSHLSVMQYCKWIHAYILRMGFESDVSVCNALMDMYAKCGNRDLSRQLFDRMPERNVVSWSAMIARYAQNGNSNEALRLFQEMQLVGVKPDLVTVMSVLPACAHLAALQQGRDIHDYIIRNGFESDISVGTALVDMYAKCGSLEVARQVFDNLFEKDVVSWNVMIAAYGMHGQGEDAIGLFSQMQQTGTKPDHVTFTCVLSACTHAGLVEKGWLYFNCMSQDHCVTPRLEHYAYMVDLLSRAGHLDEALDFIKKMPLEPDAGVWGALLGACRTHCNIEMGRYVSQRLLELEPKNAGNYVLLSNIFASAGNWDGVAKMRTMLRDEGLKKIPGCSWIEINNRVHEFHVGDKSHPESDKIYALLEGLAGRLRQAGYVPDKRL